MSRPAQAEVGRFIWDAQARELALVYEAEIDGGRARVCEMIAFDAAVQVICTETWYGPSGAGIPMPGR